MDDELSLTRGDKGWSLRNRGYLSSLDVEVLAVRSPAVEVHGSVADSIHQSSHNSLSNDGLRRKSVDAAEVASVAIVKLNLILQDFRASSLCCCAKQTNFNC